MKDFLDQELHVGDFIVAVRYYGTSASLARGQIIGFTNNYVRVELNNTYYSHLISPEKIVRIVKNECQRD